MARAARFGRDVSEEARMAAHGQVACPMSEGQMNMPAIERPFRALAPSESLRDCVWVSTIINATVLVSVTSTCEMLSDISRE